MLDLTLQITADATQAKAALRDVEQGIQKVESASSKTGSAIDKVTGVVATHRTELSKVEQAYAKAEAATTSAERATAKLSGTSADATAALSGLRGEGAALSGGFEALATAGGLSVGMMTGLVGGAIIAASVLGALIGVIVDATKYYYEHSDATKDSRVEQENLTKAWHVFQMEVGGAVLGEDFSAVRLFRLLEAAAYSAAAQIGAAITMYRQLLGINTTQGILGLSDPGRPPKSPEEMLGMLPPGFQQRFGPGDGGMPSQGAWFDPLHLPSGAQAESIFGQDEAARKQRQAEAKRLADERARRMAQIQNIIDNGLSYRLGLGAMPGSYAGGRPSAGFDPSDMLKYQLGIHGGSLGEAVSVKDMLAGVARPSSFGSRLFGSAGGDIGHTLMRLLVERGNGGSAIGGTIGGDIMGSLMGGGSGKAISGALTGLLGGKIGGAVGKFLPFGGEILGSLVGKLFGNLFGETQGHKDLMAGNSQIDAMKKQLTDMYGPMQNLQQVGKMFGIDWQATWGDQNLKGAEHFKGLVEELAKKQAQFNDDLGGTLGKIKDLGGNIPEALIPYLDQLKSAKVLTQENIDLIATMSGQNTVDFGKMEEAANRYGISIDALGQGFKEHKMHEGWQQIIDDLDLLQRGGADMNAVLGAEGMQAKINELVQQSIHFGTTIPENMKPWIQKLIDSGKLLGEDGKAITDINKLSFGDSMQTSLEKLNATLQELIDTLQVKLPAAARTGAAGMSGAFDGVQLPGGSGGGGGKGGTATGGGGPASLTMPSLSASSVRGGVSVTVDLRGSMISDDAARDRLVDQVSQVIVTRVGAQQRFSSAVR